jgi:hypothetical protein
VIGFNVLNAIQLNDQMGVPAEEIDDVGAKWNLPRELPAIQPPVTEIGPEPHFFFG